MEIEKRHGGGQTALIPVAAFLIAILIISASVTVTLFDKRAYARMAGGGELSVITGLSEAEILANYNALIDYNSIFFAGPLEFPTLPMSDAGRIHFEEVKAIFSAFQIALIVSAALAAPLCISLARKRRFRFLAPGGLFALLIPAFVVCLMTIVGWDNFFVLFHQVFFNNDFWVFDYRVDPIILLLPDDWFLNCLIRIVLGIAVSSAALIITGRILNNNHSNKSY